MFLGTRQKIVHWDGQAHVYASKVQPHFSHQESGVIKGGNTSLYFYIYFDLEWYFCILQRFFLPSDLILQKTEKIFSPENDAKRIILCVKQCMRDENGHAEEQLSAISGPDITEHIWGFMKDKFYHMSLQKIEHTKSKAVEMYNSKSHFFIQIFGSPS